MKGAQKKNAKDIVKEALAKANKPVTDTKKKRTKKKKLCSKCKSELQKRPLNQYQKFIKQQIPILKKKQPELSQNDMFKFVARLWNALSDEDKKNF